MFKIYAVCPNQFAFDELHQMLNEPSQVALLRGFTSFPTEVELNRHLRIYAPHAILISSDGGDQTVDLIEYVRRTYPNLQAGVLCADRDAAALVPFMRAGVRETIFLPFDQQEVKTVVARLRAQAVGKEAIPKTGEVLCFLPSKPGVGASTIAVNTAAALARKRGTKVLLVDADLSSGMVRFMLQIENELSILDAAKRVSDLDEALWPQLVTRVQGGFDVVHSGGVSLSFPLHPRVLLSLLDFWRRTYDLICIDLSGNLEQFSLELMREAAKVFLVSTSELAALHLLNEKAQLLRTSNIVDHVYAIHNRKSFSDDLSKEQIEEVITLPVFRVFRNSYSETILASKEGRAVRADSSLGVEFDAFAAELRGEPTARKPNAFRKMLGTLTRQSSRLPLPSSAGQGKPGLECL